MSRQESLRAWNQKALLGVLSLTLLGQLSLTLLGQLSLTLLGVGACTVPERTKSGGTKAEVVVASPLPADAASLRYAVLWFEEGTSRPVVSDEGVVRSAGFDVELRLPQSVDVEHLVPKETIEVARDDGLELTAGGNYAPPDTVITQAYRPRIVLYDDRDGDDRLDLRPNAADSIDRVLAVDDRQGFARILDVDEMLRSMSLPQTDRFYERNPDFSGFVYASDGSVPLRMTEVGATSLTGTFHQRNRQNLLCQRHVTNTSTSRPSIVRVDTGIELEPICDGWVNDCTRASIGDLDAPLFESTPDVGRTPQCKRNSRYESLIVFTSASECADCSCNAESQVEVYVARRTQLPEWWPCGNEVGYCTQPGSLVFYSTLCNEVSDAGAPIAALDAGSPDVVESDLDAGTERDASADGL